MSHVKCQLRQRLASFWLGFLLVSEHARTAQITRPDYKMYMNREHLLVEVDKTVERYRSHMRLDFLEAESQGYRARLPIVSLGSKAPRPTDVASKDASEEGKVRSDLCRHARENAVSTDLLDLTRCASS